MPAFKKVLFIDDDVMTVNICGRMMHLVDFAGEVVSCENGREAKNYLITNQQTLPDIIFVDLHMTVMSGLEFLQWFNEWSSMEAVNIPLYVLSSSIYQEDHDQVGRYKTDGFVVKPVTAENLLAIRTKHSA